MIYGRRNRNINMLAQALFVFVVTISYISYISYIATILIRGIFYVDINVVSIPIVIFVCPAAVKGKTSFQLTRNLRYTDIF
jgi:amino acid permease